MELPLLLEIPDLKQKWKLHSSLRSQIEAEEMDGCTLQSSAKPAKLIRVPRVHQGCDRWKQEIDPDQLQLPSHCAGGPAAKSEKNRRCSVSDALVTRWCKEGLWLVAAGTLGNVELRTAVDTAIAFSKSEPIRD